MDTKAQKFIPLFAVHVPKEVDKPLLDVLHSGYIGQGPKVDEFEQILSKYFGTRNILTLNNGTAGLHLAYRLSGIQSPEDEVITTPMTCAATNLPILANNGKVVWADVDKRSGLIDVLDVERKITPRTKAIVCVDWGGTPCDIDALMQLGEKYHIKVIEDAAHAFGTTYKNRKVGTLADFTMFSLQAIKHITTVDGGLLMCKSTEDYRRGKLLRWYGIDRETDRKDSRIEEDIVDWGYKFHMNDVAATIGIVQMDHIDRILKMHRDNAKYYQASLPADFYVPHTKYLQYSCEPSYWLYTVVLPKAEYRDRFVEYMKQNGVQVSRVHARNDTHSAFKSSKCVLPNVTEYNNRMVCIPVNWSLTQEDKERIVTLCKNFISQCENINITKGKDILCTCG
jgi:dTDP-4-amino-4,6-dideoxygalactose transaminase